MHAEGGARPCPMCGGSSTPAFVATDRNRETSDERFAYRRCAACGTVYIAEIPTDVAAYYPTGYHDFDADGEPTIGQLDVQIRSDEFRVGLLREHVESGRLVEIGSGTGGFARVAKANGFDVTAIEMDARCCDYLRDRIGVTAINSDDPLGELAQLPPARVIALWHVLEHLPEPRAMLERAAQRLEPGGVLALGIPSAASLQFRLFQERWMHLDAPRHLTVIAPEVLSAVAGEYELETVALTSSDPFGRYCNRLSWHMSLRRRPTQPPALALKVAAGALSRLSAPLEQHNLNGTALTAVLRRRR